MAIEQMVVALDQIRDNPVALRSVNRDSEEYLGLVDSIKMRGLMNAISLRRKADADSGAEYFELIDGLHRLSASRDAGLTEIPATILTLDDAEVLEAQIIGNVQRIETKPVEYSKQLRRILAANPMMTESELAQKLGKSGAWIGQRLGLNKISNESICDLVNENKIVLTNAYSLAKLPENEQVDFLERAQTEEPQVFVGAVNNRLKEIKEAKRQGREAAPSVYTPTPHLQKVSAIKEMMDSESDATAIISGSDVSTVVGAFQLGLQWALHLDPTSIAAGEAKWNAQQQAKAEAKERRKAEREAKKAAAAAAAADKAAHEEDAKTEV